MSETAAPALTPRDMTPALITRHFSPAWFAAVMGTAVLPLALSFTGADWLRPAAAFFTGLAALVFVVALAPWSLRFFLYRDEVRRDFNHPVAASFLPTMPIAMLVIALDLLKFPDLFMAPEASRAVALALFTVGSAGIWVMGFAVILRIFRHEGILLAHANFGWFIPPVSKLLVPVAGFELAGLFPQHADLLVGFSLASLGAGFFLYLFVGSAVMHRYIFAKLPPERLASTFFIGIAPTAIIAVALFKLMHLAGHHEVLGLKSEFLAPLVRLAMLMLWGLAAWWFIKGIVLVVHYARRRALPFALSWWAFTFPTGALAVCSGVTFAATKYAFVGLFYNLVTFFLLLVWLVVFVLTVRGVASRKLFVPAH
jgi:C4-dicarboxylate transporter/malic acid transport protein